MKEFTIKRVITVLATALLLVSCGGEDLNDAGYSSYSNPGVSANIEYTQLVGTWSLQEMRTETPVDLNKDNVESKNLLSETTCFDKMSITFKKDKTFFSVNSRIILTAGESNSGYACNGGSGRGPETGTWEISGDILTLTVMSNDQRFSNTKKLSFNGSTFLFKISEYESGQYVSNTLGAAIPDVTIGYIKYKKA